MPSFRDRFALWNRKLHYYAGLYLLFFLWLFAFTGILLNHSSWAFAQFFPNRKVTKFERAVPTPPPGSDTERAKALMRQLGIEGEIAWNGAAADPTRLEFSASQPGHIYQVQADLRLGLAKVTLTEFNAWGVLRALHTFSGVSTDDPRNQRDWAVTTVWAASMDAVALGVVFLVFSSYYMWWGMRNKRGWGLVAVAIGVAVCGLFVIGLGWLYA